jgi:hypothetical protein
VDYPQQSSQNLYYKTRSYCAICTSKYTPTRVTKINIVPTLFLRGSVNAKHANKSQHFKTSMWHLWRPDFVSLAKLAMNPSHQSMWMLDPVIMGLIHMHVISLGLIFKELQAP